MSDALLNEVHYTLGSLISDVGLPVAWWSMGYDEFLTARRPLISRMNHAEYQKLSGGVA